tara:strand:- start:6936 stop:7724 length:789 start_codon:yes stop_codon:yes gene_type:complete
MIIDLHNHTINSFDAFTSSKELLSACKKKQIDAIAITEHDKFSNLDKLLFANHGIELINGCEYTTSEGAHIIGLFIDSKNVSFKDPQIIINHVKSQGGILVMPHPFKPGSGFLSTYGETELIKEFDFIEILNGGYIRPENDKNIINLSNKFNLRMISSSDSHKGNQVGLCVTEIKGFESFKVGDAKSILDSVQQVQISNLYDKSLLKKSARKANSIQQLLIYQLIINIIPYSIRRLIKVIKYKNSSDGESKLPNYVKYINDL